MGLSKRSWLIILLGSIVLISSLATFFDESNKNLFLVGAVIPIMIASQKKGEKFTTQENKVAKWVLISHESEINRTGR